jgi:hypothetical protein
MKISYWADNAGMRILVAQANDKDHMLKIDTSQSSYKEIVIVESALPKFARDKRHIISPLIIPALSNQKEIGKESRLETGDKLSMNRSLSKEGNYSDTLSNDSRDDVSPCSPHKPQTNSGKEMEK